MFKNLYTAVLMVCDFVTYSCYFGLRPSSTVGVSVDTNCNIYIYIYIYLFKFVLCVKSVQSEFMALLMVFLNLCLFQGLLSTIMNFYLFTVHVH